MPNPPVLNDVLEIKVYAHANDGQIAINRTHWIVTAVTSGSVTLQDIAIAFEATIAPSYKAWFPQSATFYGVTVKSLAAPQTIPFPSSALRGVGTGGTLLVPKQAAALLRFRTDLSGPSQRGRLFIPFIDAGNVGPSGEVNLVGMPLLNAIRTAYGINQTVVAAGGTCTFNLVILNPDNPVPPRRVTASTATNQVATQKSRGAFGETNSLPF